MARIDRFTKTGCVEPYCFPDLKHSTEDSTGGDPTRPNAFKRQFSGSPNDETRSGKSADVCPPPWVSVNLVANRVPGDHSHSDPESYREIIDRMIQESEQQLKEVYAKGREEGRQEGLKQGREQGKREGYDIGKREGILQGQAEGEARITPLADALREALDQLDALRKAALHEARMEGVKLALFIAERILGTQLRLRPDGIQGIIEKACAMAAPSRILRVKLHPDAVEYCQKHSSLLPLPEDVVLVSDSTLACGGCVLETESGEIDARIESQLQVLLEGLERELELSRYADSAESLTDTNVDG